MFEKIKLYDILELAKTNEKYKKYEAFAKEFIKDEGKWSCCLKYEKVLLNDKTPNIVGFMTYRVSETEDRDFVVYDIEKRKNISVFYRCGNSFVDNVKIYDYGIESLIVPYQFDDEGGFSFENYGHPQLDHKNKLIANNKSAWMYWLDDNWDNPFLKAIGLGREEEKEDSLFPDGFADICKDNGYFWLYDYIQYKLDGKYVLMDKLTLQEYRIPKPLTLGTYSYLKQNYIYYGTKVKGEMNVLWDFEKQEWVHDEKVFKELEFEMPVPKKNTKELDAEFFNCYEDLLDYVNDNDISKEDIQSISVTRVKNEDGDDEETYILFHWIEITK